MSTLRTSYIKQKANATVVSILPAKLCMSVGAPFFIYLFAGVTMISQV